MYLSPWTYIVIPDNYSYIFILISLLYILCGGSMNLIISVFLSLPSSFNAFLTVFFSLEFLGIEITQYYGFTLEKRTVSKNTPFGIYTIPYSLHFSPSVSLTKTLRFILIVYTLHYTIVSTKKYASITQKCQSTFRSRNSIMGLFT